MHIDVAEEKDRDKRVTYTFLMASFLQNVFNAYKTIRKDESKDFQTLCIELSDEIFEYSQQFIEIMT